MQKAISTIAILFVITGCTALNIRKSDIDNAGNTNTITIKSLEDNNITNTDFELKKIEIVVLNKEEKEKLLATLKYSKQDEYLLSIRSTTGIEAARIYISQDTILANDRINKKLYYGDPDVLEKKYGIYLKFIPVLLGDLIFSGKDEEILRCISGKEQIQENSNGAEINYKVDCRKRRIISTEYYNNKAGVKYEIEFRKTLQTSTKRIPGEIVINDFYSGNKIIIDIKRAEFNTDRDISIIPGKDYEQILIK